MLCSELDVQNAEIRGAGQSSDSHFSYRYEEEKRENTLLHKAQASPDEIHRIR